MKRTIKIVLLSLVSVLIIAAVSASVVFFKLDHKLSRMTPANTYLAGVDISRMTRAEAVHTIKNELDDQTDGYTLVIKANRDGESREKSVSLSEFINCEYSDQLDEVLEKSKITDLKERVLRVFNYLTDQEASRTQINLHYTLVAPEFQKSVEDFAEFMHKDPVNATRTIYGDSVNITPEQAGTDLDIEASLKRIEEALKPFNSGKLPVNKNIPVEVASKETPAEITASSFQGVITINLSSHKLHLFQGDKCIKTYKIGCGAPGFETPTGLLQITRKRKDPTWVNPDPQGWGINMPEKIGPGPGNPLGPRALDLNRPAIRIHGVSDHSKLGVSRSHGCINMAYADVIDLFEYASVGMPVNVHY